MLLLLAAGLGILGLAASGSKARRTPVASGVPGVPAPAQSAPAQPLPPAPLTAPDPTPTKGPSAPLGPLVGFGFGMRGPLVTLIQAALKDQGIPVAVDGDFGDNTRVAVQRFQALAGLGASGIVTPETWGPLTKEAWPLLFERGLMLTAAFEGHGYTKAIGSGDNAGGTWGIIGFTMKSGSLGRVLDAIPDDILVGKLGPWAAPLLQAAQAPTSAERVALGAPLMGNPEVQGRLALLGWDPMVRSIQDDVAHDLYWAPAQRALVGHPLEGSERAALIAFDSQVQQGHVSKAALESAREALAVGEEAALEAFALGQAEEAPTGIRPDVEARRMTIAHGEGVVHKRSYFLNLWGVA